MSLMESPPGPRTVVDGREYLYFAGTGYLGLQGHPELIRAACEAMNRYGLGSATTRAWFGTMPPVRDVEQLAARFLGTDDALYYGSGYLGGLVLVDALGASFDMVLYDELAHFSLRDAARLAGKPARPFRHRDPAHLAELLRATLPPSGRPLVLSDGVFSVMGFEAPVRAYAEVLAAYPGAILGLDDAHGTGTLGARGRGTLEAAGLAPAQSNSGDEVLGARLYHCGTLSKALGGYGGVIAGSGAFIGALKSRAPVFIGASAPPVPAAAASARALALLLADPSLHARLVANVGRLKAGLRALGLTVPENLAPVMGLICGTAPRMRRIRAELLERGILVAYAEGYSGVGHEGALRLAVFATHSDAMIDQLLDELARLL